MQTLYPQCTELVAAKAFKAGRFRVRPGQRFWVCGTKVDQERTGTVSVAREGAEMGSGFRVAAGDLLTWFTLDTSRDDAALEQARADFCTMYAKDVAAHPEAFKAHVRENPEAAALSVIEGLGVDDVKRMSRELAAEMRKLANAYL